MENVCLFFKYGFCKYRETCRQVHYEEICDIVHCESLNCAKRHPKDCRYFSKFKRCKFGSFCLFSHEHTDVLNQTKDKDLEVKTNMLGVLSKNNNSIFKYIIQIEVDKVLFMLTSLPSLELLTKMAHSVTCGRYM